MQKREKIRDSFSFYEMSEYKNWDTLDGAKHIFVFIYFRIKTVIGGERNTSAKNKQKYRKIF